MNATGRDRAQALVGAVGGMGVTAIYSRDLERNLDTVRPLARHAAGLEITRTAAVRLFSVGAIVDEILDRQAGGVVLGPVEYGDLHIVTVPAAGAVTVVKRRYGP
ncbi:MAG TPA: histidine phosphatase family protein [Methylomirabilota bacterium]|nr:histidine phosphatase family protein [Methylomirabilota bacterium]